MPRRKIVNSGKIALATAMSDIAANLLLNGRTFHSRFKVPLQIQEDSTCSMSPSDANGKRMQLADFVVIDEVSMGHKFVFETLNRSLQDLRDCSKPFGGVTVLFAGDWRQVLPVVRYGSRPQIVNATLKMSPLWAHVHLLKLKENMRVKLTGESADCSDFPLTVGNGFGRTQNASGQFKLTLPKEMFVPSKKELIEFVFGKLDMDTDILSSKAIICATNASADEINANVMSLLSSSQEKEYKSCDSVEENEHQYPIEFINKLCPSGLPPHRLHLKKGSIIMLLRNLDPQNGHCNGTRYVVEKLYDHIIDATVAVGPHKGERIYIPRIPMVPSDNVYPFSMRRKQFPVLAAFAITANKAQGQTLKAVGIYLPEPFFSHGQLYVALSRVGNKNNIKVCTTQLEKPVDNVVYPEILTN